MTLNPALRSADVFLVHINGEGMAEPPYVRLFPQNLVNHNDGPRFYNLRASFEGRLRVPDAYVRAADIEDNLDPFHMHSASQPTHAGGRRLTKPNSRALPVCKDGMAPGRWVFHHSLYPDVPGEPLEWRPYGCHYRRISGEHLERCLKGLGVTQLLGESTLGQMHDTWHLHMQNSTYYWPARMIPHTQEMRASQPQLRGGEYHGARRGSGARPAGGVLRRPEHADASRRRPAGMSRMLIDGLQELRATRPQALIMLQGANDPARDSLGNYAARLDSFLEQVTAMQAAGEISPSRTIWIGAPTRIYKARGACAALARRAGSARPWAASTPRAPPRAGGRLPWTDAVPREQLGQLLRRQRRRLPNV